MGGQRCSDAYPKKIKNYVAILAKNLSRTIAVIPLTALNTRSNAVFTGPPILVFGNPTMGVNSVISLMAPRLIALSLVKTNRLVVPYVTGKLRCSIVQEVSFAHIKSIETH